MLQECVHAAEHRTRMQSRVQSGRGAAWATDAHGIVIPHCMWRVIRLAPMDMGNVLRARQYTQNSSFSGYGGGLNTDRGQVHSYICKGVWMMPLWQVHKRHKTAHVMYFDEHIDTLIHNSDDAVSGMRVGCQFYDYVSMYACRCCFVTALSLRNTLAQSRCTTLSMFNMQILSHFSSSSLFLCGLMGGVPNDPFTLLGYTLSTTTSYDLMIRGSSTVVI